MVQLTHGAGYIPLEGAALKERIAHPSGSRPYKARRKKAACVPCAAAFVWVDAGGGKGNGVGRVGVIFCVCVRWEGERALKLERVSLCALVCEREGRSGRCVQIPAAGPIDTPR